MKLQDTLNSAVSALKNQNVAHALIGGFALAAYGVARATQDIDLLVDGTDQDKVRQALMAEGFRVVFQNNEVLQLSGVGQLDIIFANRPFSQQMLKDAQNLKQFPVPVVLAEDLIGLKVQAYMNNPKREFQDKADILAILQNQPNIDYVKIKVYADLFNEWPTIEEIKKKI